MDQTGSPCTQAVLKAIPANDLATKVDSKACSPIKKSQEGSPCLDCEYTGKQCRTNTRAVAQVKVTTA